MIRNLILTRYELILNPYHSIEWWQNANFLTDSVLSLRILYLKFWFIIRSINRAVHDEDCGECSMDKIWRAKRSSPPLKKDSILSVRVSEEISPEEIRRDVTMAYAQHVHQHIHKQKKTWKSSLTRKKNDYTTKKAAFSCHEIGRSLFLLIEYSKKNVGFKLWSKFRIVPLIAIELNHIQNSDIWTVLWNNFLHLDQLWLNRFK